MKLIEETTIDKSTWGSGPWQSEPDKVQWPDPATGLPCLIVRNYGGALCGYVGVSEGHPYFKKEYGDVDVSVHGGLTYSGLCTGHICHIPEPGEPDHVWWLGFDCGHFMDVSPAYLARHPEESVFSRGYYRDLTYVREQVTQLAAQLKEAA
jgi:hypothetical protein